MAGKLISIVVPCFNEEACVDELVSRLEGAARGIDGWGYEIVLVNDGSTDATWNKIEAAARASSGVVGVNLSRNHGHQLTLTAGLSVCSGDRILIIDADLQDPPELLPALMERMDDGFDVVYGRRRKRDGETWFKRASAAVFYRLLGRMSEVDIPVDTGDFRLMSRRALETLMAMPEQHRFIRGMVSWIGFPQSAFVYDRAERYAGTTKYPLRKMIRFALDAVTSFSTRPLRAASQMGFVLAIAGLAMIAYTLISHYSGQTLPGWTSLMIVVVILGSLQMFVLGVIGEYLGRLYMEAKNRPLFIIQDIVRAKSDAPSRTPAARRKVKTADPI